MGETDHLHRVLILAVVGKKLIAFSVKLLKLLVAVLSICCDCAAKSLLLCQFLPARSLLFLLPALFLDFG